jgi:hypothetical protein
MRDSVSVTWLGLKNDYRTLLGLQEAINDVEDTHPSSGLIVLGHENADA